MVKVRERAFLFLLCVVGLRLINVLGRTVSTCDTVCAVCDLEFWKAKSNLCIIDIMRINPTMETEFKGPGDQRHVWIKVPIKNAGTQD